jgi:Lon protease-like protein
MTNSSKPFWIPLFPLQTVLFPAGVIALKIFEVRYLDMMKTCFKNQDFFGIVGIEEGAEIQNPSNPDILLSKFGTLAKIVDFDPIQPALYMTRSIGHDRFSLLQSRREKNGLWMGEVQRVAPDPEVPIPEELSDAALLLSEIIVTVQKQGLSESQLPFQEPYRLDDCAWVSNRLAEILPLSVSQKNHLLMQENPRLRLDLIQELLEDGVDLNSTLH